MHLHLERDDDPQTLQFVAEKDAQSERLLMTPEFEADRDAIKTMIEREDRLIATTRRGNWLFDFHRSADHPLGRWYRLPADLAPCPMHPGSRSSISTPFVPRKTGYGYGAAR